MRNALWLGCLLAVLGTTGPVGAQAGRQFGPRPSPPTFSPYLNLLRQGSSPAVNYFGIVRPEVEARSAFQNLQGQINDNRRAVADVAATDTPIPTTGGKSVSFLNTGGYFMNLNPISQSGVGGVSAGGTGGGGAGFNTFGGMSGLGGGGRPGRR